MRLSNTISSIVALSLFSLVGCKQVEIPDAEKPNGWGSAEKVTQEIKVENTQELGLPESVEIKDGLTLSVFSSMSPGDNNLFTFSNSAFTGEAPQGGVMVAMYPYSSDANMTVEAGKMYVNTNIPSTQNFVVAPGAEVAAKSVASREDTNIESNEENNDITDNSLHELSFAVNTGDGFKFKSVYSKVTLPIKATYEICIDSISIVGGNGEKLAGNTKVEVGESISPVPHMADTASVYIGYKGNLTLTSNKTENVVFSFLPQNFTKGLTVSLFNEGKEIENKKYGSLDINTEQFTIDEFQISEPQYYIEYKADAPINIPGYICEHSGNNGKIYFASSTVPANLLQNNTDITELTIPANISVINEYAFNGCSNLTKVTFNEGLKEIKTKAFLDCNIQGELKLPSSVTSVLGYAFQGNESITSVSFGNVEKNTDMANSFYTNIISDSKLTKLGYGVFNGCSNIEGDIVLPNSVTAITESFINMGNTENKIDFYLLGTTPPSVNKNTFKVSFLDYKIFVPSDAVQTYKQATGWAANYSDRIYPIGEQPGGGEIEEHYVKYTTSDNQEAILHTTDYKEHTFDTTTGEGKITFNTSTVPNNLFYKNNQNSSENQTDIISLEISTNMTVIGNNAFRGCEGLTTVEIPSSVTKINGYAFGGCSSLQSITFGNVENDSNGKPISCDSKLTSIGDEFLKNCSSITHDIILPSTVELNAKSFNNLNLPSGSSVNLYIFKSSSEIDNVQFTNSNFSHIYVWENGIWEEYTN